MAQYRAKGPDGRMYKFEGPEGLSSKDASFFLGQYLNLGAGEEEPAPVAPVAPPPQTGFIPSVKRGFMQTGMLLGDVLPAMAARAVGADEYANRQLAEAAATQKEIQQKYPSAVPSFTDIKGAGDAVKYITEAVGETIPSILPGLFTGGAASVLGRGAVLAAKEAAEKTALSSIAEGVAADKAKEIALQAGVQAARRTALKYQAAGAITGSAAQNVPEVFQNILEETGKEDLGAALLGGGFNAMLDAILPVQLLRKAGAAGIPSQEIVGAWYKRGAAGLGKGFLTEGATEAAQEMSSAAAVKFVDDNKDFFTKENLVKFIDAGLKGGIGGGVITGATDVVFGRAEPERRPPPPPPDTRRSILESFAETDDATEPFELTGGKSPGVAGVAGTRPPAGRPVTTQPDGMVSTPADVGQPPAGEGTQSGAVARLEDFSRQYNDLRQEANELMSITRPTEADGRRLTLVNKDLASVIDANADLIGSKALADQLKNPMFDGTQVLSDLQVAAGQAPVDQARGMPGDLFGGYKNVLDLANRALAIGRGDPQKSVQYLQEQLQRFQTRVAENVDNGIWGRTNAPQVGLTPQEGFDNPKKIAELYLQREEQRTAEAIAAVQSKGAARGMAGDLFSGDRPAPDVGTEKPESLTDVFGAPEKAPKKPVRQAAPSTTAAGPSLTPEQRVDIFASKKQELENQRAASQQEVARLQELSAKYPSTKVQRRSVEGASVTYDLGSAIKEETEILTRIERDLAGVNQQLAAAQAESGATTTVGQQLADLQDQFKQLAGEVNQELQGEQSTFFTPDFYAQQRKQREEKRQAEKEAAAFGSDEGIVEEPVEEAAAPAVSQKERVVAPSVDTEHMLNTVEGRAITSFFDAVQPASATPAEQEKFQSPKNAAQSALLEYDIAQPGETTTPGGQVALRYLANRVGGMEAFQQLVEQLQNATPEQQAFLLQRAGLPNLTTRRGMEEFSKQIQEYLKQLPGTEEGIPTPQRSTPSRVTKTAVPYKEDIEQDVTVTQVSTQAGEGRPRRPGQSSRITQYTISDTRVRTAIRMLRQAIEQVGDKLSGPMKAAQNYLSNRNRGSFGDALLDLAFDLAMYELDPKHYGANSTFYGEGGKYAQDFRTWMEQNLDDNTIKLLDELIAGYKATAAANAKFEAALTEYHDRLDAYKEKQRTAAAVPVPRAPKKSRDRVSAFTPEGEREEVTKPKVSRKNLPQIQGLYEIHPAIRRALDAGDTQQALKLIAETKSNPYYALLAERLLEAGITAKTELISRDTIAPLNDTPAVRESYVNFQAALREFVTTTLPESQHAEIIKLLESDKLRDLEQAMKMLGAMSQDRSINVTDAQVQLIASAADFFNQQYGWIGKYDPATDTIFMRSGIGMTNHTFLHEVLHAATIGMIDNPSTLTGVRKQGYDQLLELYTHAKGFLSQEGLNDGNIYGLKDLHEFVSEALTNPEFQATLRAIRYKGSSLSLMSWFTEGIRKLFNIKQGRESNVLNEVIFAADAMLLGGTTNKDALAGPMTELQIQSQAKGMARKATGTRTRVPVGRPNSKTSLRNYMTSRKWSEVQGEWPMFYSGLKANLRPLALGALTLRQIADLVNKRIPQVGNFIQVVEDFMSRTNRILQESGDIAKKWQRLQARDPEMSRQIGAVMHRATIQRIDPDKATAQQRNTDPDLMTMWRELDPEAKQIYRDVRNFYERRFSEYKRTLRTRVVQMRQLGVSETTINEIRNEFEKGVGAGPYFPLMRYGRFWYQVGRGSDREYYMFENFGELQAHMQDRLARDPHLEGTIVGPGDQYKRDMNPHIQESNFLKAAFSAADQANAANPNLAQDLKDSLYQAWLINQPETSFRNRFVHRKAIEGFSQDALRNFSSSSFHMAYQQARFEYSPNMFSQITAARMQLKDRVDQSNRADLTIMRENQELSDYVREMERRLQTIMNPEDTGVIVSTLSNIGFLWYLTSFASAATNVLGGLTIGLPTLIGQQIRLNPNMSYTTATLKSLGQMKNAAMQIMGTGFGLERGPRIRDNMVLFPSLNRASLSRVDQAAYNRFVADGLIDITATYDQSGLSSAPTESYDGIRHRAMTALAALFHNAERFNREVVAMSAFRAGMEKRANYKDQQQAFAESIAEAKDVTTQSMFDYSTANKPRYMQHPAARVILQFKQFPQQMTFFLTRNFQQMIKGASPEVRREATARFVGTMGITGIMAGTTGVWGFSTLASIVNAVMNGFGDDDEEPFDFELEYVNWAVNTFGTNFGLFLTRGAGNAAGVDLHSRLSLDNMWFRDGRKNLDEEEAWRQFLVDLLGPTVGLTVSAARAVDLYNQGHADRALEAVAPGFIKQPLIAARYGREGVQTLRGDKLVEDVGPFDLFMQSLGFRPAEIAEIQYYNITKKGQEQEILKKRQNLLNLYGLAFIANDADALDTALEKIMKYNDRYPSTGIQADTLNRSIKQRMEKSAQAEHGLIVDKRLLQLLDETYIKQIAD
jgi:hypothetical protein